ncbi:MAG TPA: DUF1080 domain-containing protein, partial [Pirellulales bacterium]|nr:DUF1080 domain-containing protein [Pirellulales bacterium]
MHRPLAMLLLSLLVTASAASAAENEPPAGFTALFNGRDLTGWYGLNANPEKVAAMPEEERAKKRAADLEDLRTHWHVENGELVNDGHGVYATTDRDYGDIELYVDYKMLPKGDSGIYLRGTPQIQIWDYTDPTKFKLGADKGSGGLWNNSPGAPGKDPLVLADKPFGEWNRFHIIQIGARTTVYLNDKLVVDHAIMENYWDRTRPLFRTGPVQLQTHGSEIRWRNVFVREIPPEEADRRLGRGFAPLFNGKDLTGWEGSTENYEVVDGAIRCKPQKGGVLYTHGQYSDFIAQVEIKLPPGGNNGLAIRYPGTGDAAYSGMCELQVLDTEHPKYSKLDPRQAHGSAYGMIPAKRGYLRPTGEWNFEQVTVRGSTLKVELNGTVILEGDLSQVTDYMASHPHPGKDLKVGHFGFAGHG